MGMFTSAHFDKLDDLFLEQLNDLYDAEQRLIKALPKMAQSAHSSDLSAAFNEHLAETRSQAQRLEEIFKSLNLKPGHETCEAMKGLVSEGEEMIKAKGDPNVKDAALIAAAQRVEHYEIAGYGTARTLAQQLGNEHAAQLLQQTLNEEAAADDKLTQIATQNVNLKAARV